MADQPQREEETNCRGEGSCMSGQLQIEEETNCREEEDCMSGQLQGEEETNCRRGEEGCMSGQPQRGRRPTAGERMAVCQVSLRERRAVRRSPGCWVEELLCARVEPTAAV